MFDKKTIYQFFDIITNVHQTKSLICLLGIMILVAILEVCGIGCILPVIHVVLSKENPYLIVGGIRIGAELILFGTLGIFLLKNSLMVLIAFFQTRLLQKIRHLIGLRLFHTYLSMPYLLYLDKHPSRLIILCFGEANVFASSYAPALCLLVSEIFIVCTIFSMLAIVSPVVTFMGGGLLICITYIFSRMNKKILRNIGEVQHNSSVAIFKHVKEALESLKETRLFGSEKYFLGQFEAESLQFSKASNRVYVIQNSPKMLFETLMVLFLVLGILLSKHFGIERGVLLTSMTFFGAAMLRIMPSFNRITNSVTTMRATAIAIDAIHTELGCAYHSVIRPTSKTPNLIFKDQLTVSNLSFTYPRKDKETLSDVSFEIKKGMHVGIVGKSGAGKTTLIDILLGIIEPQGGDIQMDGTSIFNAFDQWRHLVGYVPQMMTMIDSSIKCNIAFGISEEDIDSQRLAEVIKQVQLNSFIEGLPQGIETVIGDRGIRISGGQRQRIAIARALYQNPEILIFDEATSSLDLETEHLITQELFRIGKDKTLIVIAHRLSTIMQCDVVILIEDGKLIDQGTYADLSLRNKWFSEIQKLSEYKDTIQM